MLLAAQRVVRPYSLSTTSFTVQLVTNLASPSRMSSTPGGGLLEAAGLLLAPAHEVLNDGCHRLC